MTQNRRNIITVVIILTLVAIVTTLSIMNLAFGMKTWRTLIVVIIQIIWGAWAVRRVLKKSN
jgi:hypothetical protein